MHATFPGQTLVTGLYVCSNCSHPMMWRDGQMLNFLGSREEKDSQRGAPRSRLSIDFDLESEQGA